MPAGDVEALAAAARELLEDADALARAARAGAERARATLTWDAAAAAHLELYRELAVKLFRRPFADVIERQLDLFERDHADLIADCEAAEEAYDAADRDEAEERYGDYVDLVETGTEALADLRDGFARTLDDERGAAYEEAFNRAVARRLPRFALEIRDR